MATAREILNEYKWREDRDFLAIRVIYIHRGAKDDLKDLEGADILMLGKSFMKTTLAWIPYHRIVLIKYENKTIWKRKK
jgi:uncharacterized protein (UPF0248 family)